MLDAVVTDINTVAEGLREVYTEKDGKFYLQVKPVEGYALENIAGLTSALSAERTLKEQAEAAAKPFKGLDPRTVQSAIAAVSQYEGITPEAARNAVAEVARLTAIDPQAEAGKLAEAQVAAAKAEMERLFGAKEGEYQGQITAAQGVNDGLKAQLKSLLVGNELKAAIAKYKAVEGVEQAVELLAERSIRTVEKDNSFHAVVVDAAGNPRMKVEGASFVPFTISDLMAEIKQTTPGLFQAEEKNGVGIQPGRTVPGNGGQVNPWSKESWNQTEQAKLRLSNPTLAAQMKAQAGVK